MAEWSLLRNVIAASAVISRCPAQRPGGEGRYEQERNCGTKFSDHSAPTADVPHPGRSRGPPSHQSQSNLPQDRAPSAPRRSPNRTACPDSDDFPARLARPTKRVIAAGGPAMSVRVVPYTSSGWEVDIRYRLPNGQRSRERRVLSGVSKSSAQRWGQERERHQLQHG